ncbi:MAG: hypothetical protein VX915_01860 [Pseudomonadota bacterium]|nr:hypothetical protein [Pseudomonadota bacterium]
MAKGVDSIAASAPRVAIVAVAQVILYTNFPVVVSNVIILRGPQKSY